MEAQENLNGKDNIVYHARTQTRPSMNSSFCLLDVCVWKQTKRHCTMNVWIECTPIEPVFDLLSLEHMASTVGWVANTPDRTANCLLHSTFLSVAGSVQIVRSAPTR